MPGRKHEHTPKADRMVRHIEQSAKKEGRYRGRERDVAWATVHKEMPKSESHLRGKRSGARKRAS